MCHQVVTDVALLIALVAIVGDRALQHPRGFITYLRVVVDVDLQRALVAIMDAKAEL